ncbi:hypothetical protein [Streptomyces griseoruber]|uniref:Uncharacterized protein n=1 Tax=Streptomyces griseoruber TaxID=1943 RepID=A0A117RAE5_9ACTN|nr:hypothetical protein [Streptomyces griseoruber]KUN79935.1 hypothetical protein AQJ64_26240 [Streptomyces griseoruber]
MPVLTLVCAAIVVGVEQTIQWKYGTTGAVGLLLLSIGIKVRSPALSSVGAVVLALVATGPAVSS